MENLDGSNFQAGLATDADGYRDKRSRSNNSSAKIQDEGIACGLIDFDYRQPSVGQGEADKEVKRSQA